MQENKLSRWSIAAGAWRDAFQAIGAMRAVTVTAALVAAASRLYRVFTALPADAEPAE